MAQNITLLGASYADVPAVQLPKTGGGTATFTDVTPTTAGAADVASGKLFFDALGVLTQGTASGGGGASNVVTGTFKGTTTGAAMDVDLAYSGNGWVIALLIWPAEGAYNPSGTFGQLISMYANSIFSYVKNDPSVEPPYASAGSSRGKGSVLDSYKSSASDATLYTTLTYVGSNGVALFSGSSANGSAIGNIVRMKSKAVMSVYIQGTSYGFAPNIEYKYMAIYSE